MNEPKHAPGPWRMEWGKKAPVLKILADNDFPITTVPVIPSITGYDIPNACLIAAAPELREALAVLLDHAQEQYPHFESERGQRDIAAAQAAIAKAEGAA